MVVRRRGDADDVGLHHGTVAGRDTSPSHGHLSFDEVEHLGDRLVVCLDDESLDSCVGNTP